MQLEGPRLCSASHQRLYVHMYCCIHAAATSFWCETLLATVWRKRSCAWNFGKQSPCIPDWPFDILIMCDIVRWYVNPCLLRTYPKRSWGQVTTNWIGPILCPLLLMCMPAWPNEVCHWHNSQMMHLTLEAQAVRVAFILQVRAEPQKTSLGASMQVSQWKCSTS